LILTILTANHAEILDFLFVMTLPTDNDTSFSYQKHQVTQKF